MTVESHNVSFNELALEHLEALYGYAMALTRAPAEAEDLLQETYLRAVKAFGHLAPDSKMKPWLFVIMRNTWLNELRRRRNRPGMVELDPDDDNILQWRNRLIDDPHLIYLRKLEREEIREAIESLPLQSREIVVLRDIEGFSYQEIATMLECPAGTVMSRLSRARDRLRRLLTGPKSLIAKAV